jgi:hypothetical protein
LDNGDLFIDTHHRGGKFIDYLQSIATRLIAVFIILPTNLFIILTINVYVIAF